MCCDPVRHLRILFVLPSQVHSIPAPQGKHSRDILQDPTSRITPLGLFSRITLQDQSSMIVPQDHPLGSNLHNCPVGSPTRIEPIGSHFGPPLGSHHQDCPPGQHLQDFPQGLQLQDHSSRISPLELHIQKRTSRIECMIHTHSARLLNIHLLLSNKLVKTIFQVQGF